MRLLAAARDANHYHISRDDRLIATLGLRAGGLGRVDLAEGGALLLRREGTFGKRYSIYRDAPATPGEEPPGPILRATLSNPLLRVYDVTLGARPFTLRAQSLWHGDYQLNEGAAIAGLITSAGRSRDARATLPDDLPQDAAIALFCLVLAIWRHGQARVDTL